MYEYQLMEQFFDHGYCEKGWAEMKDKQAQFGATIKGINMTLAKEIAKLIKTSRPLIPNNERHDAEDICECNECCREYQLSKISESNRKIKQLLLRRKHHCDLLELFPEELVNIICSYYFDTYYETPISEYSYLMERF